MSKKQSNAQIANASGGKLRCTTSYWLLCLLCCIVIHIVVIVGGACMNGVLHTFAFHCVRC